MRIEIDNTFPLNGVTSNICMLYDEGRDNITTAVIGRIQTRVTKGRKTELKCGSGFDCAELPFARGHIIALEIGGSDNKYNVVPQFQRWQNKGAEWRNMEEFVAKYYDGHLMVVEIGYNRPGGVETHDKLLKEYQANPFVKWTDRTIPDKFTIRIFDSAIDPSSLTTVPAFNAALVNLAAVPFKKDWNFVFPDLGKLMPADEEFLARKHIRDVAKIMYEEDKETELKRGFSAASTAIFAPGNFAKAKAKMKEKFKDVTPGVVDGLHPVDVAREIELINPGALKKKILKKRKEKITLDEAVVAAAGYPAPPPAAAAPAPKGGTLKKAKGGD